MSRTVTLTSSILQRIIAEERAKLEEGKKSPKMGKVKPAEPKIEGKKNKSSVPAQIEKTNKTARKELQLEQDEVEAADLAGTLVKQVKHLKEMKEIEARLRRQLQLVVEQRTSLEIKLSQVL
jgi:hypothetical protein